MNFLPDQEDNKYRDRIRAVADEFGWAEMQALRAEIETLKVERYSFAFHRKLAAEGFIGLTWPEPWGKSSRPLKTLTR